MTGKIRTAKRLHAVFMLAQLLWLLEPAAAVESQVAGQLNLRAGAEDGSLSGSAELRLMPELKLSRTGTVTIHYEAVALERSLSRDPDTAAGDLFLQAGIPDDTPRLLDLTQVASADPESVAYHRLDRLAFTHSADWGSLTLGRSAITWGNGQVFNSMDLFNPFAPTDVERDYKMGDDLLLLTLYPADWNNEMEWQLLVVPRRSVTTGSVQADKSSFALKAHAYAGGSEWDLLAAWHYDEAVLGIGHIGFIGNAVWRWDTTLTFAEEHHYMSTVANLDYSWTWQGMNYYGSIELHYNTVGSSDYRKLAQKSDLIERLMRGEMHTLGRLYIAPSVQVELHPLVNFHLAAIVNMEDPSAVVLPRFVWSVRQDIEATLGASLYTGEQGTEFGGIPSINGTGFIEPENRLYLWIKAYF